VNRYIKARLVSPPSADLLSGVAFKVPSLPFLVAPSLNTLEHSIGLDELRSTTTGGVLRTSKGLTRLELDKHQISQLDRHILDTLVSHPQP